MEYLMIRNWREYQHYTDRCPPWIKIHSQILDKPEWRTLTDTQKAHLVAIWVLASRVHGDKDSDAVVLRDTAYLSALTGCQITARSIEVLIEKRFFIPCKHGASGVLAPCKPSRDAHARSASASVSVSGEGECEGKGEPNRNGFDRFWDHYPRRVGKRDARKAWQQTKTERPGDDDLIAKVDELAVSKSWIESNGQYVPYPATWLRRGGWEDEVRE